MKEEDLVIGVKGYVKDPDLTKGPERSSFVDEELNEFVLVPATIWNAVQRRILELKPDAERLGVVYGIPKTAVYHGKLGVMKLPPQIPAHLQDKDLKIPVPSGEGALFWIRTDEVEDES